MKKYNMSRLVILLAILTGFILPFSLKAQDKKDIENCIETKNMFIKTDGMMKSLFDNSAGYVIFPNIGKGAIGVGGATGNGILFEKGKAIGKANMSQLTVGLQAGGQVYREVIFFENEEALNRFRGGKFEFAGQASAVAVKAGVSTNIKYREGVMVFTQEKGGLMYEASVGGQKFSYTSF